MPPVNCPEAFFLSFWLSYFYCPISISLHLEKIITLFGSLGFFSIIRPNNVC